MTGDDLHARRILVVEDNFLVSMSIASLLRRFGCEVVGPFPSVAEGLAAAQAEDVDGAVLDINIAGGTCAPIAELLQQHGCPFLFITGYASPSVLPAAFASVPRLEKPIDADAFRAVLGEILG